VAVSSPRAEIAAVRELTRYRKKLTEARTSELQRLCKILEEGGVKIDSVASSITTVSARAMVAALIAGNATRGCRPSLPVG
jgi:transposase